MTLTDKDKRDYLKLALSENVGPIAFRDLLKYFGSPARALAHIHDFSKKGMRKITVATDKMVDDQLKAAATHNAQIIFRMEPAYPRALLMIEDAPPMLFCIGHTHLLNEPCIGFVGTRNASLNGKNFARYLANNLSENGYVVVSGMARGIDASSHEGALKNINGRGGTVAVLGTGADVVYPTENKELYAEICQRGCVISEFPFGTAPQPQNFPRRNRIISGLSKGVVVIEAQAKSGSLITSKYAADQGREVFAVPGSPVDPRSEGTNMLIQQGATLVAKPADVLNALEDMKQSYMLFEPNSNASAPDAPVQINESDLDRARALVLENLSAEPVGIDDLIRTTQLTAQLVHICLVELELVDKLERHPRNRVSLLYKVEE